MRTSSIVTNSFFLASLVGVPQLAFADASVVAGDTAAIALKMYSDSSSQFINTNGNEKVKRAQAAVSIGQNTTGLPIGGNKGQIMASWDEIVGTTTNTIVVNIFTSDGQTFLPEGYSANGQLFTFWNWNFGVGDSVTWRAGAATADLIQARFQLSSNSGADFFQTKSMTANLTDPWTGTDQGLTQADLTLGVNYVRLSYEVAPIPAPGALGLLGCVGLVAVRRRR